MQSRPSAVLDALAIACTAAMAIHVLDEELLARSLLAAVDDVCRLSLRILTEASLLAMRWTPLVVLAAR